MTEDLAQKRIADDLVAAGLRRGGIVLVHSSLKSMGHVPGGCETVVRGLIDALGPDGTLLMPALSYATVHAEQPVFDVANTPSCVGAITEHFRTRNGTIRSVHPTHSVCGVGPEAEQILEDHHRDHTPCGANSPYRRLRDRGGQVLMLGCGLKPNTSMHGVEELIEPPYLFGQTITYRIILPDGSEGQMTCRRHGFAGFRQRYDRIGPLLEGNGMRTGKVLEAAVHILDCSRLWEVGASAVRRNPLFFVETRD
jgi:aminoglycoside 3-N-acetyltransferase